MLVICAVLAVAQITPGDNDENDQENGEFCTEVEIRTFIEECNNQIRANVSSFERLDVLVQRELPPISVMLCPKCVGRDMCLCYDENFIPDVSGVEASGFVMHGQRTLDFCEYHRCLKDLLDHRSCNKESINLSRYKGLLNYSDALPDSDRIQDHYCTNRCGTLKEYDAFGTCLSDIACQKRSEGPTGRFNELSRCSTQCVETTLDMCAKVHCPQMLESVETCNWLPAGPFCEKACAGRDELECSWQLGCINVLHGVDESNNTPMPMILAVVIPAVVLFILVVACAVWCLCFHKESEKVILADLPPAPDLTPQIISALSNGEYTKGKLLGRGQFGSVYMILLPTGTVLAAKQLDVDGENEGDLQAYIREITMMRDLCHSNIVKYYYASYLHEEKVVMLFMEYVSGGSLGKLVRQMDSWLSERQGSAYIKQILTGLEYLHGNNIAHRDIKGENILVDANGICKISDFGCSKRLSSMMGSATIAKTITGTPHWMAPEIITNIGKGEHDVSVDIWSVGITTCEILNQGKPPWPEFPTHWAAIYFIGNANNSPNIPERVSDTCRSFINDCLVRKPSDRPTATELLLHPWLRDSADGDRASRCSEDLPDIDKTLAEIMSRKISVEARVSNSLQTAVDSRPTDSLKSAKDVEEKLVHENVQVDLPTEPAFVPPSPSGDPADDDSVRLGTVPTYVLQSEMAAGTPSISPDLP